ncbi:unnamed protein product [Closterium sp. NIES-53]
MTSLNNLSLFFTHLPPPGMDEPEPAHEIPYEDLVEATKNWADDLQLGEGGSAIVYKGVSPDGELWAVKRGKKGGLTRLQDYHREVRQAGTEGERAGKEKGEAGTDRVEGYHQDFGAIGREEGSEVAGVER